MNGYVIGKFFVWIILTGTAGYICWRIYEAIYDPYGYGRNIRGITVRIGIGLSTVADLLIVYSSIVALFASTDAGPLDELKNERALIGELLKDGMGWLIIIIGVIVCFTAVVQWWYGITAGYKERINMDRFPQVIQRGIRILAIVGYVARELYLVLQDSFSSKRLSRRTLLTRLIQTRHLISLEIISAMSISYSSPRALFVMGFLCLRTGLHTIRTRTDRLDVQEKILLPLTNGIRTTRRRAASFTCSHENALWKYIRELCFARFRLATWNGLQKKVFRPASSVCSSPRSMKSRSMASNTSWNR